MRDVVAANMPNFVQLQIISTAVRRIQMFLSILFRTFGLQKLNSHQIQIAQPANVYPLTLLLTGYDRHNDLQHSGPPARAEVPQMRIKVASQALAHIYTYCRILGQSTYFIL